MVDRRGLKRSLRSIIGQPGSTRRKRFWRLTELFDSLARLTAMFFAALGAVRVVEAGGYLLELVGRDGFTLSQEALTEIVLMLTASLMMLGAVWFFYILATRFPVYKRRYRRVQGDTE